MNSRTLGTLAVITLVIVALAFWMNRGARPTTTPEPGAESSVVAENQAVFIKGLAQRVNDVAEISLTGSGKSTVLKRDGSGWVLASRANFPVDFAKVRDGVLSLAELAISEPKTQDPAKYDFLGVAEPSDKPDSTSRKVVLKDAAGAELANIIVGASAAGMSTPGMTSVYVRKSAEKQAYLAKGRLDPRSSLDVDPMSWVKRDVIAVDNQRIKSVSVTSASGPTLTVAKGSMEATEFNVQGVPSGRELKTPTAASPLATALSIVTFDDVMPVASAAEGATPGGSAEYRTWDGLVVTIDTSSKDGIGWVTVAARFEPPPQAEPIPSSQTPPEKPTWFKSETDVKKEAAELNSRLGPWAFAIPAFKIKTFQTIMDDLLKPIEPAKVDQSTPPGATPSQPVPKIDK